MITFYICLGVFALVFDVSVVLFVLGFNKKPLKLDRGLVGNNCCGTTNSKNRA